MQRLGNSRGLPTGKVATRKRPAIADKTVKPRPLKQTGPSQPGKHSPEFILNKLKGMIQ